MVANYCGLFFMARILEIKQSTLNNQMKNIKYPLQKLFILSLLCLASGLLLLSSCKKEEFESKQITYELSGNFGKSVLVKYTPTEGTIANVEEEVTLPWGKEVMPNAENASVGLVVIGANGTPRANVIAKVLVNGTEVRTVTIQADANGDLIININHLF